MSVVYVNNLTVNSGEDFDQDFDLLETGGNTINLTNYFAKAQIRKHPDSSTAINFTVGFPNRAFGKINLSIPSWITSNLKQGRYVYDVLVTKPGGKKEIVLEGSVLVRAGISTGCSFSSPIVLKDFVLLLFQILILELVRCRISGIILEEHIQTDYSTSYNPHRLVLVMQYRIQIMIP